ncbi:uncharacterized protein LOC125499949 isoform X1 [Athalia rosae]|uniref:uncharacterized protein LOC125499949 isoform X1 n=1 Tax=Athalia rosae TaxID=37344 RepID=UPI0020345148|nr:uncharacterized protein LOC125499949 isoform X1 [Athalia rosae]
MTAPAYASGPRHSVYLFYTRTVTPTKIPEWEDDLPFTFATLSNNVTLSSRGCLPSLLQNCDWMSRMRATVSAVKRYSSEQILPVHMNGMTKSTPPSRQHQM